MPTLAEVASAVESRIAQRDPWEGVKFTEFCRRIDVQLTPGQMAFAQVAYDGIEPRDLPLHLREIGLKIFGHLDTIPRAARRVVCVVAGARAGKTYVIGALRCLHLALTVDISTAAPGEDAFAVIISADPRQREQCFKYIRGAAIKSPQIRPMLRGAVLDEDFSGSEFFIYRKDGPVGIESIPPKPGGGSGRGRSLVCALLEEAAFFQDENHKVNDKDVFTAVKPRVLPGGQTILSSTPWSETGVLYDTFVTNHPEPSCAAPHLKVKGTPSTAIAAHAPTLLLRDNELTQEIVASEYQTDPDNADREFGAQFLSVGSTAFFNAMWIAESIDTALFNGVRFNANTEIAARGVDLGFVNDAAVGVDVSRSHSGYRLLGWDEIFAAREKLKPSQVLKRLGSGAFIQGIKDMVADQHYLETAREEFGDLGLDVIAVPGSEKSAMFNLTRLAFNEGNVKIPNEKRLLDQLRAVTKKPLPGGGFSIQMPRTSGGHCDIVSGLVHAIWHLSRQILPEVEVIEADPVAQQAADWRERAKQRVRDDEERENDPRKAYDWMLG